MNSPFLNRDFLWIKNKMRQNRRFILFVIHSLFHSSSTNNTTHYYSIRFINTNPIAEQTDQKITLIYELSYCTTFQWFVLNDIREYYFVCVAKSLVKSWKKGHIIYIYDLLHTTQCMYRKNHSFMIKFTTTFKTLIIAE